MVSVMMHRLDALRILAAKLAEIEQEHRAEIEAGGSRDAIDAKGEARALGAVFDFLQNCKIEPTASLLRVFTRYLQPRRNRPMANERQTPPRSRAS
jgi:hypothetical protein